jgi:hypothetical protein
MIYKAYSFDLDDNLLLMPSKIYLENQDGKEEIFETLEFEKIRPKLKELNLKIKKDSYKEFTGRRIILKQIKDAKHAGSWRNLVKCISKHASVFSIITTRKHPLKILKKAIKIKILKDFSKKDLENFKINYCKKYNINPKNKQVKRLLSEYLNKCKFYPISNKKIKKKFNWQDLSDLKVECFKDFKKYLINHVKENFGENIEIRIGFSDDSLTHLNKMTSCLKKEDGLYFYQTINGKKKPFPHN